MNQKGLKSTLRTQMLLFISLAVTALSLQAGVLSTATSNAGSGAIEPTEYLTNPAFLGVIKGYHVNTDLSQKRLDGQQMVSEWSLSLIDHSPDTLLPGAFRYSEVHQLKTDLKDRNMALSLGKQVSKNFSVGFNAQLIQQAEKESIISVETRKSFTALDLAALYSITEEFNIGAVIRNINKTPQRDLKELRQGQLGLGYSLTPYSRVKADLIGYDDTKLRQNQWALGVDNYLNPWFLFQMGFGQEFPESKSIYSAGVGFDGPRFAVHYSYQKYGEEDRHGIDFNIPIW